MKVLNSEAIAALIKKDVAFEQIIQLYGLPPDWSRPDGFETLCRIILEQQVSLESGKAAYEQLRILAGEFTPASIASLTTEEMRQATISRQKAGYITGLARYVLDKKIDFDQLRELPYDQVRDVLISVKGIGPWTAEVYLLFALQAPDIYPKGDIALINTIKELWHVQSADEATKCAEKWSPHRSAASFLLWHYYLSKRGRVSPG